MHYRGDSISRRSLASDKGEAYLEPEGDRPLATNSMNNEDILHADWILQRLLSQSKTDHGSQHPLTLVVCRDLGILRVKQRRLLVDNVLLMEQMMVCGDKFGIYHIATLDHVTEFALLFQYSGKAPKARADVSWCAGAMKPIAPAMRLYVIRQMPGLDELWLATCNIKI